MPGGRPLSVAGKSECAGYFGIVIHVGESVRLWKRVRWGRMKGQMYLIRRGERARPICIGCKRAGDEGAVVPPKQAHLCKGCLRKLDRGESMYIDPDELPDQRAM